MNTLYFRLLFVGLFFLCSSAVLIAQQKQKQIPAPAPKPAIPARPAPKPRPAPASVQTPSKSAEKTYYAYLLVTTDLDVKLSVNGDRSSTIHTVDDIVKIGLDQNDNIIRVTPLDGGTDGYTFTQKAERPGNIVLAIDLGAKRSLVGETEERRKQEVAQAVLAARNEEAYQPIGQEMIFVKGGTFLMGDASGNSDEKPVHSVTVSDFYLGTTEVTQAHWQAVMGSNPSFFKNCDQCPVESVSWDDVQEFIKKLNAKTGKTYRLPTEAEWEYAARGGGKRTYTYAGSNSVDEVAWYSSNAGEKTQRVGEKKPNELGLYDMSGNVWEWCQDWYGTYPYSSTNDPKGSFTGSYRVFRGGSWDFFPASMRVAYRGLDAPNSRSNGIGFRLARQQ